MLNRLSIEEALQKVGHKNRYQILVFIQFLFLFFFSACIINGGPYLYHDPVFLCSDGQECKQKKACEEVGDDYRKVKIDESKSTLTFTYTFQMYCNRRTLKSANMSLIFVGCCVGTFFFSYITDKYGRKLGNIVSFITTTFGTLLMAFPQNVAMLMVSNFIYGMGDYAANTVQFLILSEQSIGKFRSVTTGFVLIGFTLASPVFCLMSYGLENNWKYLVRFCLLIPTILLNIPNFFIVESPRYYLNKSHEKVISQFNKIAQYNRKPQINIDEIDLSNYKIYDKKNKDEQQKSHNYLTLFKYKSLRTITITAALLKFLMTFVLYGQTFALEDLDLNLYVGGIFSGTLNLLAYFISGVVLVKLKRKTALLIAGLIISTCCTTQIFFKVPDDCNGFHCWQRWAQLIVYSIGCSVSSIFFVVIATYFPELFPTSVRGMGVGFIRGFGIAGSILSPYAIQLFENLNIQPLIPIGIVGFITLLLLFFFKETKDLPLQDTIEEELDEKVQNVQIEEEKQQFLNQYDKDNAPKISLQNV